MKKLIGLRGTTPGEYFYLDPDHVVGVKTRRIPDDGVNCGVTCSVMLDTKEDVPVVAPLAAVFAELEVDVEGVTKRDTHTKLVTSCRRCNLFAEHYGCQHPEAGAGAEGWGKEENEPIPRRCPLRMHNFVTQLSPDVPPYDVPTNSMA